VNVLKLHLRIAIETLLAGGTSHREIERRTGVDRKTIRRLAREANSSGVATGSSAAPQYDRPSLGKTIRPTNVPSLGTRKLLRPPQALKVSRACGVIGEYPLQFWERRRETTGIHARNLDSESLMSNKPDRQVPNYQPAESILNSVGHY